MLRRFAPFALTCILVFFGRLGHAQQIDVTAGYSTLRSSKQYNASQNYIGPAESGGTYVGASVDYLNARHLGFNGEFSVLYKSGLYNGFQGFRPVFYDVNAMFAPPINRKFKLDFMAGMGGETLIFYNNYSGCGFAVCTPFTNSTHFALHLEGGLRYYFWRKAFVRPEAHLYIIPNNYQFSSDYVWRFGASVGYTWGSK